MYKGFDLKQGIDIAWSRILQDANGLADEQMTAIVGELEKGIDLDHPNIIKCYRAWHDTQGQCINFITEFFTSGNLRDFRQKHKHLEVNLPALDLPVFAQSAFIKTTSRFGIKDKMFNLD